MQGSDAPTKTDAKKDAALEALRLLHAAGGLDAHLRPAWLAELRQLVDKEAGARLGAILCLRLFILTRASSAKALNCNLALRSGGAKAAGSGGRCATRWVCQPPWGEFSSFFLLVLKGKGWWGLMWFC